MTGDLLRGKDSAKVVDLTRAEWIDRAGARLQEVTAFGKRLRVVEFLPGFSDPNWCVKGHVVYVLEGRLDSEYDDGLSTRQAGEAYIIPWG